MMHSRIGRRHKAGHRFVAVSAALASTITPVFSQDAPAPAPKMQTPNQQGLWPTVPQLANKDAAGRGIQRTMRLLATSTPTQRNTVRILFYGQSITEQDWSRQVADDLRKRFPNANLQIENRAIGGFASQLLINPAEHDLYPFYPDLVIFHVYGSDQQYEEIIRNIRSRTTAEVLMQRDHVAAKMPDPKATPETDKGLWWDNHMNSHRLPEIARTYGCGLADVRGEWLRYLQDNHLPPKALLKDDVHLNAQGCFVMAQIINQYLVYRPELAGKEPVPDVRDVSVGKEARWDKGRLVLEFEGNRLDLLPGIGAKGARLQVRIDGRAPSAHPEIFAFTRPAPNPWSPLALVRVDHAAPLLAEDWTLKVTAVTGDEPKNATWRYEVSGSLTGPDGSGSSDTIFVSKSGRVKISPTGFFRGFSPPLPVGHTITWRSYLLGTDAYEALPSSAQNLKENAVLLAQGLTNGRHRLELILDDPASPPPAIKALRVYKPSMPAKQSSGK
ncbi:MAG: SGNH/GDSL hydrolase family protein [Armatimonadota bacterium]